MTLYGIPKCSERHAQPAHILSTVHNPVGQMQTAWWETVAEQRAWLPFHVRQASLNGLTRLTHRWLIAVLTVLLSLLLVAGFAQPVAAHQTLLGLSSSPKTPSLLWQAGISLPDMAFAGDSDDLQLPGVQPIRHVSVDLSQRTGLFGLSADAFSPFSLSESETARHIPHSGKRSRAIEASLTVPLVTQRLSQTSRLSLDLQGGLGVLTDDPRGFDGRNGMSFSKMLGARLTYLLKNNVTLSVGYRFRHTSNASLANAGVRSIAYGPHAFFAEVSYFWS